MQSGSRKILSAPRPPLSVAVIPSNPPQPPRHPFMPLIFKICPENLWRAATGAGVFAGSAVDLADGFIHFSTAAQAVETAARHFSGQADLVLVAVEAEALGDALRHEPSRGGAL